MIRQLAFALAILATGPLHAEEKFDYAAALALATERTDAKSPGSIIVLGPEQNEEYYPASGPEAKRLVPYCRPFRAENFKSLEKLLSNGSLNTQLKPDHTYTLLVYRSGSSVAALKLQGDDAVLKRSQYPLQDGDIVVITEGSSSGSTKK